MVGDTPLCQRLKVRLEWWRKNASQSVVETIKNGIKPPWTIPPLVYSQSFKGRYQFGTGIKILTDYQESGSIKMVEDSETQHLILRFLISKPVLGGNKM